MGVILVNESAMGCFVASWKARTGARCVLTWGDGLDGPMFEFYVSSRGCMSPPIRVRNPERFGWTGPPRKFAEFRAFAQAFADAADADDDADDAGTPPVHVSGWTAD
jgi:hypothetical protein